ncbi:MAG: nicotinamide riboside transporter PnuC [Sphingobacteriaceae bacterium]
MNSQDWLFMLEDNLENISLLQFIAVVFGVASVLLARKNNLWLYPTGLVGTIISIFLLFEVRLYAESVLNVYYVVMSVYGWIYWVRKRNERPIKITYATRNELFVTLGFVFIGWGILYMLLRFYTPSDVPLWDAFASSTAWAGMWLLARRKMENWILLNVSNLFAIPLLFHKELPLFAALTLFLFVVAFFGYFDWKKLYNGQENIPATNGL